MSRESFDAVKFDLWPIIQCQTGSSILNGHKTHLLLVNNNIWREIDDRDSGLVFSRDSGYSGCHVLHDFSGHYLPPAGRPRTRYYKMGRVCACVRLKFCGCSTAQTHAWIFTQFFGYVQHKRIQSWLGFREILGIAAARVPASISWLFFVYLRFWFYICSFKPW